MEDWARWQHVAPRAPELAPGFTYHVFLSHRTVDRTWVSALNKVLMDQGFKPFLDYRSITPGQRLTPLLQAAIEGSENGMLIWSVATGDSFWVRQEYERFERLEEERDFTIIPIKLDEAKLPESLSDIAFQDFSNDEQGSAGYKLVQMMYSLRGEPTPDHLLDMEWPALADTIVGASVQLTPTTKGLEGVASAPRTAERRQPQDQRTIGHQIERYIGPDEPRAELHNRFMGTTTEQLVVVSGPPGSGRTTLIRAAIGVGVSPARYPHGIGVFPEIVATAGLDDVLNAIWDQFWKFSDDTRTDPAQQAELLAQVSALIVLPNIHLDPTDVRRILEVMPESTLVITTVDDGPYSDTTPIGVSPLSTSQALELFGGELGRPVPRVADEPLRAILETLNGRPGLIRALALQARNEVIAAHPPDRHEDALISWIEHRAQVPRANILGSMLSPAALGAVVASQAIGADVDVPSAVLADLAESSEALHDAVMADALTNAVPRGRVSSWLLELLPPIDNDAVMARVLASAVDWVEGATDDQLFDDRAFVIRALEWAVANDRWDEALVLGTGLEGVLAAGGRWESWEGVLDQTRKAAQFIEPAQPTTEALALHQLGSRARVMDNPEDAYDNLRAALDLTENVDPEAAEITRNNLRLLPLALTSVFSLVAAAITLGGLWAAFVLDEPGKEESVIVDVEPELIVVDAASEIPVTVWHEGGRALTVTLPPDRAGLRVVAENCEEAPLDGVGASCSFVLAADPAQLSDNEAPFELVFDMPVESVTDAGDTAIRIVKR